mmetsp:Transcript_100086/g.287646  ORF Transcript_100086/g.287646 Transcript_100086/m.287646 type:complete len:290 (-) Transcript_100086:1193-2062(-)
MGASGRHSSSSSPLLLLLPLPLPLPAALPPLPFLPPFPPVTPWSHHATALSSSSSSSSSSPSSSPSSSSSSSSISSAPSRPSSSRAFGFAPCANESQSTSRSGSRSSVYASLNSCNNRRVAAACSNRWNSTSPTCSRKRSAICFRTSLLPRHRCKATSISTSTSSTWAVLRSKASTAVMPPVCAQTHSGQRKLLSRSMSGHNMSSIWLRAFVPEMPRSSSNTSGVALAPCSTKALTPAAQRCCTADNRAHSPTSRFTSAFASTSAATEYRIVSDSTWMLVDKSWRAVRL